MALQLTVPDLTCTSSHTDAYIKCGTQLNTISETGLLELYIYKSADAYNNNKQVINRVEIPVGSTEVLGDDDKLEIAAYSDFKEKTEAQIETQVKTYNIDFQGTIVDMSTASVV